MNGDSGTYGDGYLPWMRGTALLLCVNGVVFLRVP